MVSSVQASFTRTPYRYQCYHPIPDHTTFLAPLARQAGGPPHAAMGGGVLKSGHLFQPIRCDMPI